MARIPGLSVQAPDLSGACPAAAAAWASRAFPAVVTAEGHRPVAWRNWLARRIQVVEWGCFPAFAYLSIVALER
jgi:hypothetical protein